jgi:hypothetical protein
MFSLIISIIAIALVAALALASIYYGGDAFQEGTAKAEASTVINQGQQVQAAVTMAEIDEVVVADGALTELTTGNYLKEIPQVRSAAWTKSGANVLVDVVNAEVCGHIENSFDGDATLGADDAADAQAFGCYLDVDASKHVAYYKL